MFSHTSRARKIFNLVSQTLPTWLKPSSWPYFQNCCFYLNAKSVRDKYFRIYTNYRVMIWKHVVICIYKALSSAFLFFSLHFAQSNVSFLEILQLLKLLAILTVHLIFSLPPVWAVYLSSSVLIIQSFKNIANTDSSAKFRTTDFHLCKPTKRFLTTIDQNR